MPRSAGNQDGTLIVEDVFAQLEANREDPTVRETSNPVFRSLPKQQGGYAQFGTGAAPMQGYGADPYAAPYQAPYQETRASRPLTIDDVVTKTGITLAVLAVSAVVSYFLVASNLALAMPLTLVGAFGGLGLVLVATFGRKQDSPAIVLSYAVLEGLFLGAISFVFANLQVSHANAGVLIGEAVLGTFGVFFGMLVVYKTGAIRVTPKFTRMLVAAMFGVLVLMLGNFVLAMFGVGGGTGLGLRSGGPAGDHLLAGVHRHRGVQLPDRLRRGRPDGARRCAGQGGLGYRPGPDRDPGLALHRDPASAQLPAERLALPTKRPARRLGVPVFVVYR